MTRGRGKRNTLTKEDKILSYLILSWITLMVVTGEFVPFEDYIGSIIKHIIEEREEADND